MKFVFTRGPNGRGKFVFTRSPNHLKELSAAQLESVCRVTTAKLAISLQLNANKLKDSFCRAMVT